MGSPPRAHKLVHFLALVSTVSALSLANFQIIASNAIPPTCIKAYSRRIPGCSIRDFTGGSLCSSKCTNGLLKAEAKVEAACGGVDVNRDTLLGIALRGDLIATLCPGVIVAPTSTTVTVTVPRSTPPPQTLPPPPPSPAPPRPPPPPPAITTRTTLSTVSTSTAAGTTVPETASTPVQTSVVETTAPPSPPSATPTNAGSTQSPQTTATAEQPSPASDGGRPPVIGGGGSPFDQPVTGSGRSTYTVCWAEAIWAALGATIIILC